MKLFPYYLSILVPLAAIALFAINEQPIVFVVLIFVYAFIYRPIIDFLRLKSLGLVTPNEFKKMFIPLWRLKHFKNLFFKN